MWPEFIDLEERADWTWPVVDVAVHGAESLPLQSHMSADVLRVAPKAKGTLLTWQGY